MTRKRIRNVPIYVWVRQDELEAIQERMASLGVQNMSAYIRKMALNGYVLHVDLAPVKELVSLLRRCSNNINGDTGQYLRRDLSRGDRKPAAGL